VLPRIPRTAAEAQLDAQGCIKDGYNSEVPGQWYRPPYGPKFFVQFCKDDPDSIDSEHFTFVMGEVNRYAIYRKSLPHS
jgi:hypothetical protein